MVAFFWPELEITHAGLRPHIFAHLSLCDQQIAVAGWQQNL